MRELKAIIRKTFGNRRTNKPQKSPINTVIVIGFVIAVLAFSSSLMMYVWGLQKTVDLNSNLIVVNAPQSWCDYMKFDIDSESVSSGQDVVLDYSTDELIKGSPFEDRGFKGRILFTSWDSYYDTFTFSSWMKENNAGLTVVFPKDFDYMVKNWQSEELPEILTYYPSDHIEYRDVEEVFSFYYLEDGFLKYWQNRLGIPSSDAALYDTDTIEFGSSLEVREMMVSGASKQLIPFLFFIAILYTSMIVGMEAIAGEKERGTFAALLMTPVPRRTIVLGNFIGIFLHTMMASGFLFVLVLMSHFDCSILDYVGVLLLVVSLALFVSGITLIVSVLNSSIAQAQTTFLPIFLIFLVVCVNCMQNGTINETQYYLPIYGHFYGIGNCLLGEASVLQVSIAIIYSLVASLICIIISERLLYTEQFTVAIESRSNREIRKLRKRVEKQKKDYVSIPRSTLYGYVPYKRKSMVNFLIHHAFLPLIILSIFQPLGMIPAISAFLKTPASNSFMAMIKSVRSSKSMSEISDLVKTSLDIFNMFMKDKTFILYMGVSYWIIILIYILTVKYIEHNKISTMGLTSIGRKSVIKNYLIGMGTGFVLISSVYLILIVTGQVSIRGFALNLESLPLFMAYILMWIPQGATEEIMFRGFMLPRVASRFGIVFATFFSSICFGIMHSSNSGFTFVALFNLILIASLFAYIAYKCGHIYVVCAMHTVWNFCQGNVYGLEVSGQASAASVLSSSYSSRSLDLLTGGSFGPEGGLAVTVVISLAFIVAFYVFEIRKD